MAPTIRKTLLAILLASAVSSLAVAADTTPEAGQAKPENSAAKDPRAPYSAALFPLIEKTQAALVEAMTPVESALADELVSKSKKFLADKQVYQRLVEMAYERAKADDVTDAPDKYAKQSLAALTASIRLTPGVMGRDALVNRAKLMSQVAKFYSKHDPSMCRYIPADFSILMSVDAPWVAEVDDTVFTQALDDEIDATKRMMAGSLPIGVNDSDAQLVASLRKQDHAYRGRRRHAERAHRQGRQGSGDCRGGRMARLCLADQSCGPRRQRNWRDRDIRTVQRHHHSPGRRPALAAVKGVDRISDGAWAKGRFQCR